MTKRDTHEDASGDCAIKPGCSALLDGDRLNVGKKAEISFVSGAVNVIVAKPNQVI